jgi:hypothetical protein
MGLAYFTNLCVAGAGLTPISTRYKQITGVQMGWGSDGNQLVLAFIGRQALDDYFRVPGDQRRTLQQWNLVAESNRATFEKIITAKYERGERSTYDAYGQSYPLVVVNLGDMQGSGEGFTDDVLKLKAEFQPVR